MTVTKLTNYVFLAIFAAPLLIFQQINAEIVLNYEFDEVENTPASSAQNTGTSSATDALPDSYGIINGNGLLVISANEARTNTTMGSDIVEVDNVYYRIDFSSWDTSSTQTHTKFGIRLRSADLGDGSARGNGSLCVRLTTGTGASSANVNVQPTEGSGSFIYAQGGITNPNSAGLSVIIEADLANDTFTVFTDIGRTGTYSSSNNATNIPLNIAGFTDFSAVNAIVFDTGGGVVNIDSISLGTDFNEISGTGDSGTGDSDTGDSDTGDTDTGDTSSTPSVLLLYEFDEAVDTPASSVSNTGTSSSTAALGDGYGITNGNGQLVISADAGRMNTSMGSDTVSGTVYYRIDFASWDSSGEQFNTKFGLRMRSGDTDDTPSNKFLEVSLTVNNSENNANLNTTASGVYEYLQGGIQNPNTDGVSIILGANTTTDTYSLWWDNGLSGTYTAIRENIAINLGGEVDFVSANALTFDPGGGNVVIERIVVDSDYNVISNLYGSDTGDGGDTSDGGDSGDGGDDSTTIESLQQQVADLTAQLAVRPTLEQVRDVRGADAVLISVDDNQATIAMDLETSDDLSSWTIEGNISTTIPIDSSEDIKFFRFRMSDNDSE